MERKGSSWVIVDEDSAGLMVADLRELRGWTAIVSPVSGSKRGAQVVERDLVPAWEAQGDAVARLQVRLTEYAGHAVELAKEAARQGDTGVVAVGGDGTIHEVLAGLQAAGKLGQTPLAILSQGSLNFFSVTSGLPDVRELPRLVAENSVRKASLMRVTDNAGTVSDVSFEAFHIGAMPYRVCKAASDWRFSLGGPMAGIFKELIGCNLAPSFFAEAGTLELFLENGRHKEVKDTFYWIVASHRNPYTGVVGPDMWVSTMTLANFPGFGRMMEFFEPPMEHYAGLAYCFDHHYKCSRFDFSSDHGTQSLGTVLDGDAFAASRHIRVDNLRAAWHLVATPTPPSAVDADKTKIKRLSPAASRWLKHNPPPPGISLHPCDPPPVPSAIASVAAPVGLALAPVLAAAWWKTRRHSP